MHRFFQYCQDYIPITQAAETFLARHGQVRQYAKGDFFMRPDERMPYWCMVLEGLAFGYTLDDDGLRRIHWFALPMQGFAGVRHLYTPRQAGHYIQFGADTTILRIPALRMREAKEQFPEVSEFLHIFKQQYIDRYERLVTVLQVMNAYDRLRAFRHYFPSLFQILDPLMLADHLNFSRATVYRVLNR